MSLYTVYIDTCCKFYLQPTKYPFLKVDSDNISAEDERLMDCMLDVDEILYDLDYNKTWLDLIINKAPFNGRTPREYILEKKRNGVREVKIYLAALKWYAISNTKL